VPYGSVRVGGRSGRLYAKCPLEKILTLIVVSSEMNDPHESNKELGDKIHNE
jgi:hypothetical protein